MFDRWQETIDASTSEADAEKVECKVSPGMLTEIGIYFPMGCANLARSRVFIGEKPVMPRSAKNFVGGNGQLIQALNLHELITPNIPSLNWYVWNLDDFYNHELWMYANWISDEEDPNRTTALVVTDMLNLWKQVMRVA